MPEERFPDYQAKIMFLLTKATKNNIICVLFVMCNSPSTPCIIKYKKKNVYHELFCCQESMSGVEHKPFPTSK